MKEKEKENPRKSAQGLLFVFLPLLLAIITMSVVSYCDPIKRRTLDWGMIWLIVGGLALINGLICYEAFISKKNKEIEKQLQEESPEVTIPEPPSRSKVIWSFVIAILLLGFSIWFLFSPFVSKVMQWGWGIVFAFWGIVIGPFALLGAIFTFMQRKTPQPSEWRTNDWSKIEEITLSIFLGITLVLLIVAAVLFYGEDREGFFKDIYFFFAMLFVLGYPTVIFIFKSFRKPR